MPTSDDGHPKEQRTPSPSTPSPTMTSKTNSTSLIFYFMKEEDAKRFAKKHRTELASSCAALLATATTFPLDLCKTRMQSYNVGFIATVKDTYKGEGVRAFWRGVLPPTISVSFVRTVSFSVYQSAKYAFDRSFTRMTGESPLAIANAPNAKPTLSTVTCFGTAGALAGACGSVLSAPFELTKIHEQLGGKETRNLGADAVNVRSNAWLTARRMFREKGISGVYAGYRLHLLREAVGSAVYFASYESIKQLMANARGKSPTNSVAVLVGGGLCGVISWAVIYPIDMVKTQYQKALLAAGTDHPVRPKIKFFGGMTSYRGLGVSVVRSSLTNMIFFSTFEYLKKRINALEV